MNNKNENKSKEINTQFHIVDAKNRKPLKGIKKLEIQHSCN